MEGRETCGFPSQLGVRRVRRVSGGLGNRTRSPGPLTKNTTYALTHPLAFIASRILFTATVNAACR
jgi:hypothetical protein